MCFARQDDGSSNSARNRRSKSTLGAYGSEESRVGGFLRKGGRWSVFQGSYFPCFSGDFLAILGLTKVPFGKYFLLFWGFLSKSKLGKAKL